MVVFAACSSATTEVENIMSKKKVWPFAVGYVLGSFVGIQVVLGFVKGKTGGKL